MKQQSNSQDQWPIILRKAAEQSGLTCYRLAKDAGIGETRLRRFLAGESGLSLSKAERLGRVLGLTIRKGQ